jgi:Stage II sporulation protein E (SpoIIE)
LRELIRSAIDGFGRSLAQTRNLLRLVMPQVAAAATIFFVVWVFVRNSRVYQTFSLSWLFGLITSLLLLRYTNAGHNAPILVRADGTVERLSAGGLMVGAFDWAPYEEAHTTLETGDVLLIFSDGLSEAQNESGEEYGEERLSQCAGKLRELSVDMMRRIIFDEIDKWSGVAERGDDQTLVILKLISSPPER